MTANYARLVDDWLLRGWNDEPYALVNWRTDHLIPLSEDGFYVSKSCDGQTDFDSQAFLPVHKKILRELLDTGIAESCKSACQIDPCQMYRKADNPFIRGVLWSITSKCNLHCLHCYMEAESSNTNDFTTEQMLGFIEQFESANVSVVAISGGEPFTREDLSVLIDELTKRKIGIAEIFTNATILKDEILEQLMNLGHFPVFKVSFDGCGTHDYMRGTRNCESRTIDGIHKLKSLGFPIFVITSVDNNTVHKLTDTYRFMKDLGVSGWGFAPPENIGHWKENHTDEISMENMVRASMEIVQMWETDGRPFDLKPWRLGNFVANSQIKQKDKAIFTEDSWDCTGCHSRPVVMPDGTLLPCGSYSGTEYAKGMPNVKDMTFGEAWNAPLIRKISSIKKKDVLDHNPECRKCENFRICGSGCRVAALIQGGGLFDKDRVMCAILHRVY